MAVIRLLRPEDDLGELIALSKDFFAEYVAHDEEFFALDVLQDKDIVDYFRRSTGTDEGATYIAIVDGRVVGYITVFVRRQPTFYKVKTVGAISGLMVQRDQRRGGIASALLAEAQRFFRERGVAHYTVYTAIANQGALRFYERCGMTPLYITMIGGLENTG